MSNKHYLCYFCEPNTGKLIFNIEFDNGELKINYGKDIKVEDAANEFFIFTVKLFNSFKDQLNIKISPGTEIQI